MVKGKEHQGLSVAIRYDVLVTCLGGWEMFWKFRKFRRIGLRADTEGKMSFFETGVV